MATQQRSRSRRNSSSRHRGPRHVEAVLDPTWRNPYAPTPEERASHVDALRRFALKRKTPEIVAAGVVSLAAIAGVVVFVELWVIAWVRARYMDTPFLQAVFQIVLGGVIVLAAGILIGGA